MTLTTSKKIFAIIAVVAIGISFGLAQAAEHGGADVSGEEHGGKSMTAGEKLTDGISETATGWTEIPKEMSETTEEENIVEGMTIGVVKGAAEAVTKTTEGVVKAATFFVPDENE